MKMTENAMRRIVVEKLTYNFGSGKEQSKLDKGMILIKHVTGIEPVKTITNKRIPGWGLRPGLPVGCMLTVRTKLKDAISRLLAARKNTLTEKNFDHNGTVSFGIPEYIEIPGVEYDPKIGLMGFEVSITLRRPGFRVKSRRKRPARIPERHRISKEEAIDFMKKEFGVKVTK